MTKLEMNKSHFPMPSKKYALQLIAHMQKSIETGASIYAISFSHDNSNIETLNITVGRNDQANNK